MTLGFLPRLQTDVHVVFRSYFSKSLSRDLTCRLSYVRLGDIEDNEILISMDFFSSKYLYAFTNCFFKIRK